MTDPEATEPINPADAEHLDITELASVGQAHAEPVETTEPAPIGPADAEALETAELAPVGAVSVGVEGANTSDVGFTPAATAAPTATTAGSQSAGKPVVPAATLQSGTSERVTCPECGTTATVNLRRRDSADFCRNCDFPLFWTPSQVLLGRSNVSDESLRRLPGTTGRVMIASLACPHCAEPNPVTAVTCVRCGQPMQVRREAPPPPPAPVYVPPPPEPSVEPKKRIPWWVWVIAGVLITAITVLAILWGNGTIG
jgi:hypothetical protein